MGLLSLGGLPVGHTWLQRYVNVAQPYVAPIDIYAAFLDSTPVTVTFHAGGERVMHPANGNSDAKSKVHARMRAPKLCSRRRAC